MHVIYFLFSFDTILSATKKKLDIIIIDRNIAIKRKRCTFITILFIMCRQSMLTIITRNSICFSFFVFFSSLCCLGKNKQQNEMNNAQNGFKLFSLKFRRISGEIDCVCVCGFVSIHIRRDGRWHMDMMDDVIPRKHE